MNVYAESSAVLAWLLTEKEGSRVQQLLSGAELATSSDLALVECDRAIIRLMALGQISETESVDLRRELAFAASRWQMFHIGSEIAERARRSFPVEPVGLSMPFIWRRRWPQDRYFPIWNIGS